MPRGQPTSEGTSGTHRSMGERIAVVWRSTRWPLLAAAAVATFILGYLGFREYFDTTEVAKSPTDLAYLSLQLFALESGSVPETGAPWTLEVARLAAPVIAGLAVVVAIAAVFREQIAAWRLGRERGHVVVCGLGSAGTVLANELIEAGHRVVVVERDEGNPSVAAVRGRGAAVIVGDARDPDVLDRVHLDRASHLVCVTGVEDTNADIALRAADLVADRKGPALVCLAHIRDPDLCVLMRSDELAAAHRAGFRLDFFNIDEQGARALLADHPPRFSVADAESDPPGVLIVGLNRLGMHLLAELARRWLSDVGREEPRLPITVLDPDAPGLVDRLRRRYPKLECVARVEPITTDLDPLDSEVLTRCDVPSIAYVCIDDDSVALQAALRVRQSLPGDATAVVVELPHAGGIARLIERPDPAGRLQAFNLTERTMRAELLLGGTNERLARAIHQEYLLEQRREGVTQAENPSMVPWEQLPESLRESNRDQAAHIGTKLAAVGRGMAPLTDWEVDPDVFTEGEVEMLAEIEHQRWVEQRRRDGWTAGPKDVAAKRTPYLVPWQALSEEVKEWDRQAVRGIPSFLARVGYQILARVPSS